MWTLILSALAGACLALGLTVGGVSLWGWSLLWGVLLFLGGQAGTGWLLRRRVQTLMNKVQEIMAAGQKRLQQKTSQWQLRPPGSLKQAQLELEREQRVFLEQAIAQTAGLTPYFRWSPLLRRQTDTLRMQLYYQLKNYTEVDRLLPGCLYLEPMTAAMRMARMYVRKDPGLDKFFEKQVRRLRYGQGAILYGLQAWIALQRGDVAAAHKTLVRACAKMENETIKRNCEHLANNRVKQFSNAGLGDEWYVLGLEEPRIKAQRQRQPGGRPF
ncbi:MAG: hypothetical protein PHR35_03590 [Kiritimatiellae bacterium]|nr:hypothetical protein [Kiritimatiellia bacterium]